MWTYTLIKEKILININIKKIDHSHGSPEMLTQESEMLVFPQQMWETTTKAVQTVITHVSGIYRWTVLVYPAY